MYYATVYGNGKDNYQYWNAGVTFTVDKISLDLRYWDTNVKVTMLVPASTALASNKFCTAKTFQCDENFVATVEVVLP